MPATDDCYAARLAHALRRRFGGQAQGIAERRLACVSARRQTVRADLYFAVVVVLRDEGSVFSRSRRT